MSARGEVAVMAQPGQALAGIGGGELLSVDTELGRLRAAIIHTPGPELELIGPADLSWARFDDTLHLLTAREHHGDLRQVLQHAGVHVVELRDLLAETLHALRPEQRELALHEVVGDSLAAPEADLLRRSEPEELLMLCLTGCIAGPGGVRQRLMRPLPNLLFVRDMAVVIGRRCILTAPAAPARQREAALFRLLFEHHPLLRQTSRLRASAPLDLPLPPACSPLADALEALARRRQCDRVPPALPGALEGGDLMPFGSSLLVGLSRRVDSAAVAMLVEQLLVEGSGLDCIIVVAGDLPAGHAAHLDTWLAPLALDAGQLEWLVYPPLLEQRVPALRIERGPSGPRLDQMADVVSALREISATAALLPVGGEDDSYAGRLRREREWYHQAANLLALASGKLIAYGRNRRTLAQLERAGYQVIPARSVGGQRGFLSWSPTEVTEWLADPTRKTIITIADAELVRARGGPRSLVLPLQRDVL